MVDQTDRETIKDLQETLGRLRDKSAHYGEWFCVWALITTGTAMIVHWWSTIPGAVSLFYLWRCLSILKATRLISKFGNGYVETIESVDQTLADLGKHEKGNRVNSPPK